MTDGVVTCSGIEMEMIKAIRLDKTFYCIRSMLFTCDPVFTVTMHLLYCSYGAREKMPGGASVARVPTVSCVKVC